MSDAMLIERCRVGDRRAWTTLVDRYERLVFAIPLSFGLSRDDAADVAQATFGSLLDGIDSIADPDRLGAWLSTVARRHSIRIVERRTRERAVTATDVIAIPGEDEQLRIIEDAQWLHRGLGRLNERCRELLTRLYLSGDASGAYEAVAKDLDMPIGSIGPTRARCLETLRRLLDEAR